MKKRPRDFSQAAKLVIDIASGQVQGREPAPEEQGKDPAAAALGRRGGKARAAKLSAKKRAEIRPEGRSVPLEEITLSAFGRAVSCTPAFLPGAGP
jgi:hypothetical protein